MCDVNNVKMYKNEVFEAEDLLPKRGNVINKVATGQFKIPTRFWIGCMVFLTTYINYTTRVNMSISIVSMTSGKTKSIPECLIHDNPGNSTFNATNITTTPRTLKDYGPRYEWDERIQGIILGSYFWGYVLTSLPGGWVAEWMGPFHTIFWAHVITIVLNCCSVFGSWSHYGLLIATRFLIGLCAGLIYPALQCMIAKWAPPAEKGKFVGALMGNTLGTCATWPIVGQITQSFGWDWGFYVISIQIALFCVIFWFVAADSPDQHKWITEEEKNFILEAQGGSVTKRKAVPPYKAMFMSLGFWMLAICHFGNLWGLYLQITGVPKFMAEVVGFNLRDAGFLAAVPHLTRLFFGMGFGTLGDFLKKKEILSTKAIRKLFVLCSHIIPGILLIGISFIGCNAIPIVILLTLSMSINGAAVLTNLQNAQDLAPNFAGSIFGIISFIGGMTGFITPAITGALTKDNNGTQEWGWNFIIGGCVYLFCGTVFILFGTTERQKWNEKKKEPE